MNTRNELAHLFLVEGKTTKEIVLTVLNEYWTDLTTMFRFVVPRFVVLALIALTGPDSMYSSELIGREQIPGALLALYLCIEIGLIIKSAFSFIYSDKELRNLPGDENPDEE